MKHDFFDVKHDVEYVRIMEKQRNGGIILYIIAGFCSGKLFCKGYQLCIKTDIKGQALHYP